jgi:hypothetical protein
LACRIASTVSILQAGDLNLISVAFTLPRILPQLERGACGVTFIPPRRAIYVIEMYSLMFDHALDFDGLTQAASG